MKSFKYFAPSSREEAIQLLARYGHDAKPLAGGTDLIVEILNGAEPPGYIVDLNSIDGLNFIRENGRLRIGATTVLHSIDCSDAVRGRCEMLAESAQVVGSRQIRNLATIGGNICNAVPSADTAPPLLAAEADLVIEGVHGQRILPITDFFKGSRETALAEDELLLEFVLPEMPPFTGSVYRRHTVRKALDLAIVGVAASITIDPESEVIRRATVALGAVAPVPLRATEAEKILCGNVLSDALLDEAADLAVRAARPISDVRGSANYRKDIIRVFTRRCVRQAVQRARHKV